MEPISILSFTAQQRISSLEIAKVTNKKHKNIMRDIREMEDAWLTNTGLKFELSEYVDPTGRHLPCYLLSLEQMLYVITKYNNEARAKLVLRWAELEQAEKSRMLKELAEVQQDAMYAQRVLGSNGTLTTTEIAKELGLTPQKLHNVLHEQGLIYRLPRAKTWCLYAPYDELGLIEYETRLYQRADGTTYTKRIERWSEKGHKLINERVEDHSNFHVPENVPHCVELTLQFMF